RLSRVRRSTSCPGSPQWRHHSQVRNSPWATFFDGVTTTRNISAAPLQPAGYQLRFCRQQAGLGRRRVLKKDVGELALTIVRGGAAAQEAILLDGSAATTFKGPHAVRKEV